MLSATINDEVYTPEYAVLPILEYLKKEWKIALPFDTENSNYYKVLKREGFDVDCFHLENDRNLFNPESETQDFFKKDFKEYDILISNPPFSIKDDVLERLYKIGKPFIMLLPLTALSGLARVNLFYEHGVELIVFDKRINFLEQKKGNWFASAYFCWKVLPSKLIFKKL